MALSRFFAVLFEPARPPRDYEWREWVRCDESDMFPLVLHNAVRHRGGVDRFTEVTIYETSPMGTLPEAKSARMANYLVEPKRRGE